MQGIIAIDPDQKWSAHWVECARRMGCTIDVVASLSECSALSEATRPSLLIAPVAFAKDLRELKAFSGVAMTAFMQGGECQTDFIECAADEISLLPINDDEFEMRCRRALSKRARTTGDRRKRDRLTGLASRSHFYAQMSETGQAPLAAASTYAIFWINLSAMPKVTERWGTLVADSLLERCGKRVLCLEGEHTLSARIRHADLVVIEPHTSEAQTAARHIYLQQEMNKPYEAAGETLDIEAQIGVALFSPARHTLQDRLVAAEMAITTRASTTQGGSSRSSDRDKSERSEAFGKRQASATLPQISYQPIIDLASGHVTRMHARLLGGVAKDSPQWINWFLRKTEELIAVWRKRGMRIDALTLPVNGTLIADGRFGEMFDALAQKARLCPERVDLCISYHRAFERSDATLLALREYGFGVTIDCAMTKEALPWLPSAGAVDRISIDRSALSSPFGVEFMDTLHQRKIGVLAARIESAAQVEAALKLGCCEATGHYYGPAFFLD